MGMRRIRGAAVVIAGVLLASQLAAGSPAVGSEQNDALSRGDAGNTFDTATPVGTNVRYTGRLDRAAGDVTDFYRFPLEAGRSTSVLVTVGALTTEPVTLLDPLGRVVDTGTTALWHGASAANAMTTETYGVRLAVHHALVGGDYRLQLRSEQVAVASYTLCFMNCEAPIDAPIEFIFGGSLRSTETKVLLVPPAHGDLGNPAGPTQDDYVQATLRGMHKWTDALAAFVDDVGRFEYLRDITVDIEIYDGVSPLDPAGYDVIIGYVAAGPVFRGVASDVGGSFTDIVAWAKRDVHFSGRVIALSLFGGSPRAGQVAYDFPEISDLESVTMHEFAHTFGLGHTITWKATTGPDLMNSPATFVYGDGFAGGDGGERTPLDCFSSLDLYGMAVLYRWVPSGTWQPTYDTARLPADIPYKLYC